MSILYWIYQCAFCSSWVLIVAFFATLVWFLVGCKLALWLNHSGYAFAFGLLGLGGNCIVFFIMGISIKYAILYIALLLCTLGVCYCIALSIVTARAYVLMRKKEREKIARAAVYTLPERDNQFVRERLLSVLHASKDEGESVSVSFSYVRRLLLALRNVSLPLTETLEVEELSKLFALYTQKETFTCEDVNVLNEAFAKLLKMSAKHGVIVR